MNEIWKIIVQKASGFKGKNFSGGDEFFAYN